MFSIKPRSKPDIGHLSPRAAKRKVSYRTHTYTHNRPTGTGREGKGGFSEPIVPLSTGGRETRPLPVGR